MAMTDELTLTITGLSEIRIMAYQLDVAIERYLPASPYDLRRKINTHENNPRDGKPYDDLLTVTELLMVLVWLDNRPTD